MKPKPVLLDANVIIEAFRINIWDRLVERVEVVIARSVFEDESVHWFDTMTGERKHIDLRRYEREGMIRVVDGSPARYAALRSQLPRSLSLHAGELESLVWLCESAESACFCSADRAAVRATVLLGIAERLVSLEAVLQEHAIARADRVKMRTQFLEQSLRAWRKDAQLERLQTGR